MSEETQPSRTLPPGWIAAPLGAVARINPSLERTIESDRTEVNFVPMRAVDPEGRGLVRLERRTYADVKKGYTAFVAGDVISAKITPCMENGKTTVVPELPGSVCFGSTEFHVLRPEGGVEPAWIANFLIQHHVRRAAQRSMGGAVGQMRVPASFLEAAILPIPPSTEQCRIIDALEELLTDLDAGVTSLDGVRAKLALYRASVLKAAVDGSLSAEWRERHPNTEPASELLGRILAERRRRWEDEQESRFNVTGKTPGKDWKAKYKSPAPPQNVTFSELPRTWTLTGFEQLSEGTKHALKAGPFGSALKKEHYASSGYKIYGQEQVIRGDASFGDYFIDAKRFDSLRACSMKPGDILISLVGTAGRVLILPEEASPGIINPRLLKITLSPGSVDPRFVKLVLESPQARSFLRIQAHGGTMEILNLGILKQFPIPLPPIDEQRVIVEAVENIHSIIEHSEADLFRNTEGIKILRQSILRHAFTGRLVPQSPNDQPATELLKQIIVDRERRTHETAHLKRTKVKRQRAVMRRAGQPTKKSLTQK